MVPRERFGRDLPDLTMNVALANASKLAEPKARSSMSIHESLSPRDNVLVFLIAQYVAFAWVVLSVKVKNPLYEPSLHWRSAFRGSATIVLEMTSAAGGVIWLPKAEPEVTAV